MRRCGCTPVRFRLVVGIGLIVSIAMAVGCVEPEQGLDADDYFVDDGSEATVSDPVEFTDQPYSDISGEITIEQLRSIPPDDDFVWFGFDRPYPVQYDCEPDRYHDTLPEVVDEFPVVVEGVVTLHPRFFENLAFCGSRQRYQGSYIIQDETAGVHVLRDSRIADIDVGDQVRLVVRGFARRFQTDAVIAFETLEIRGEQPVYYEEIDRPFDEDEDVYEVRRIRGEIVSEATNQNFGEMIIQSTDDPEVEWTASLDRELGNRDVGPPEGSIVELTGPVIDSFGLEMVIATLGQMNVLDEPDES